MANLDEKARFDTKLPKWQKEKFETAAKIAGYRSLTEFVLSTVNEKAETIIEKHQAILTTERDREIFFEALTNPPAPGKDLLEAAQKFKEFASTRKNDLTN